MFFDGKAISHAGDVIGDGAVQASAFGTGGVFGRQAVGVSGEESEQFAEDAAGFMKDAIHPVIAVEIGK